MPTNDPLFAKRVNDIVTAITEGNAARVVELFRSCPQETVTELANASFRGTNLFTLAAAQENAEEFVEIFLKYGVDLEARDELGRTALHIVAARGDVAAMNLLLQNGASLAPTKNGNSLLHLTAQENHIDAARILLEYGLLDEVDASGNSALIIGVMKGNFDMVKLLLDHEADLALKNHNNMNALEVAQQYLDDEINPQRFAETGAIPNPDFITNYTKILDLLTDAQRSRESSSESTATPTSDEPTPTSPTMSDSGGRLAPTPFSPMRTNRQVLLANDVSKKSKDITKLYLFLSNGGDANAEVDESKFYQTTPEHNFLLPQSPSQHSDRYT